MKNILKKVNQKGTMLVEAMAMLGLIAMVTPILYKKAAERTTELQDINAANQLRALSSAMDSYLKDNYARILRGETIVNSCTPNSVTYNEFKLDESGKPLGKGLTTFAMSHLCEYLPYGFVDAGNIQDSKLFSNGTNSFQMAVKMNSAAKDNAHTITGFFAVLPKDYSAFSPARSSRVATMVGSNGGYIDDTGTAMGAQGIWSVSNPATNLGLAGLLQNSFVVSSLQPISSQGLANEDVLHRKHEPQNEDILNTMETDLYMGYADTPANIRLVNQIIMKPMVERMAGNPDGVDDYTKNKKGLPVDTANSKYEPDLKYTLYIGNGGGSYIEGVLAAMDSIFTVDTDGISYYKTKAGTTDPVTGTTTPDTKDSAVFNVTTEKMEYGNIEGAGGSGDASSLLFRVSNDGEFLEYNASDYKDEATGTTKTGGKVIYANKEQFAAGSGVLNVTSADGKPNHAVNNWSGQQNAWSTVVGGGDAHRGAYTEYGYDENGTAANEGVDVAAAQDFALTVNGPAFVKDTLQVGKLKARDVDAAVLRAGSDPANFHNAKVDKDFYSVAKKDHFIVGNVDTANLDDGDNYPKLIIGNEGVVETGVNEGIVMRHDQGVDFLAGAGSKRMLTRNDGDYKIAKYVDDQLPQDGVIRMIAQNELMLGSAGGVEVGVVSVQETMLRAYTDTGTPKTYDTIDSVLDRYNIVSNINHLDIDPYLRDVADMGSKDSAMTVMDMMFSIQAVEAKSSRPVVDISPILKNDFISSKFTGGFAIYDHDDQYGAVTAPAGMPEDKAALYVSKGTFEVRTTRSDEAESYISYGEKIFQVDNNSNEVIIPDDDTSIDADGNKRKGSVYIRRGAINLATDTTASISHNGADKKLRLSNDDVGKTYRTDPIGYVAADRFISHIDFPENAARATLGIGANGTDGKAVAEGTLYNKYEVNPAYTSVMHDIKLTTRGGARLSDILPDFINKGIYVVDNTLNPAHNWSRGTPPNNTDEVKSAEVEASAWLGLIPTPQCPPMYSKVITINPSGFSMAQAGTPGSEFKKKIPSLNTAPRNRDINTHNNPSLYYYDTAGNLRETTPDADAPMPLTFQKNTWLKAMVVPKCGIAKYDFAADGTCNDSGNAFMGWGAVMGFIYPEQHYPELSGIAGNKDTTATGSNKVFWNLYPVYYRQLEAYATVYCYFNRKAEYNDGRKVYDPELVDVDYDQLKTPRAPHIKDASGNVKRLNDPALIYNDPW